MRNNFYFLRFTAIYEKCVKKKSQFEKSELTLHNLLTRGENKVPLSRS